MVGQSFQVEVSGGRVVAARKGKREKEGREEK
jgi:hypothetical protein